MKTRSFGTGVRRAPDMRRMSEALKGPGIDTRHWVSYGTVAVVGDGEPDFADPHAVNVSPSGVLVDVLLMPSGIPVTCRYAGIQGGGACTILAPIRPGDEVLVVIPDGEVRAVPVIVAILNAAHTKLPGETDRKPVFRNDRLSVYATDVPIEIRTSGGAKVVLDQGGNVDTDGSAARLGAAAAQDAVVKGTTYRQAEAACNASLIAQLGIAATQLGIAGANPAFAAAYGPVAAALAIAATALAAAASAISSLEAPAVVGTYLSSYAKTK
jgi:hypothetical protein